MKKKTKLKTKKGITLIALIITIAILIIITAVSISAFSDSGLIGKAMNASTKDKIAKAIEEFKIWENSEVLKEVTGEKTENIESIFKKYAYNGKIQNEDGKRYIQLKENGEKIYLSDYNNEGLVTNGADGRWSDTFKMNTPKLATGMKAINIDETTGDVTELTEEQYNTWYDYSNQKWANAMVVDKDGNKSYFVWIPRYEYKITYYTDNTKTTQRTNNEFSLYGTIDINFIPVTQITSTEGYKIHPAFEDGTSNNYTNGEWDKELSGIWVAKYEMSRIDAEINKVGTAATFKSVSSVQSARSISIGECYTYAYNYNRTLDSHLMKNSEWGAVAYLTQSKYGRDGIKIARNESGSYITGYGKDLASTTGNVTGIYDLSGGAWEYVAGYIYNPNNSLNNGKDSSGNTFVAEKSTKYATVYPYDSSSDSSANNYNAYKTLSKNDSSYGYGDAISETKGWNGEYANFAYADYPFFGRGGDYRYWTYPGVFNFYSSSGSANDGVGFRAVLAF